MNYMRITLIMIVCWALCAEEGAIEGEIENNNEIPSANEADGGKELVHLSVITTINGAPIAVNPEWSIDVRGGFIETKDFIFSCDFSNGVRYYINREGNVIGSIDISVKDEGIMHQPKPQIMTAAILIANSSQFFHPGDIENEKLETAINTVAIIVKRDDKFLIITKDLRISEIIEHQDAE